MGLKNGGGERISSFESSGSPKANPEQGQDYSLTENVSESSLGARHWKLPAIDGTWDGGNHSFPLGSDLGCLWLSLTLHLQPTLPSPVFFQLFKCSASLGSPTLSSRLWLFP